MAQCEGQRTLASQATCPAVVATFPAAHTFRVTPLLDCLALYVVQRSQCRIRIKTASKTASKTAGRPFTVSRYFDLKF